MMLLEYTGCLIPITTLYTNILILSKDVESTKISIGMYLHMGQKLGEKLK